jgi:hypothetical protein
VDRVHAEEVDAQVLGLQVDDAEALFQDASSPAARARSAPGPA